MKICLLISIFSLLFIFSTAGDPPSLVAVPSEPKGFDFEDCVICQMIWMQVEMDVGNTQLESDIHNSFVTNCNEASKTPIAYPACADMLDNIYGLVGDYLKGFSARQICEDARLCRDRIKRFKRQ